MFIKMLAQERDQYTYEYKVLNKFKSKGFKASKLPTYEFSTLYATLPHHLIIDTHIDVVERTFSREKALYLAYYEERAFFTSDVYKKYNLWSFQKVSEAFVYLFDNILIYNTWN